MRSPVLIFLAAAALLGVHRAGASAQGPARPNVVLVITDDQGYGDVGAHGNTMIRTPNLDRLHAGSTRLTNFHVDPTCSPTRSALLTGRYSARTGVWHTIAGRSIMRSDEVTVAEMLRGAGYRTGIFGKWHLGDNYPSRPQDQGFEKVLVHGGGGVQQTPDYWGNTYFNDTYFQDGAPRKFQGYCTDVFFDGALRFIEESAGAASRQPFFCYIPTNAPHGPFIVDEKYWRPYAERGVPEQMARFYGMITNVDENMGRLLQTLDRLRLAEDTLVIFMTDNGTAAGAPARAGRPGAWNGFSAGMRGQKGSQYEGGHRVPSFWRWPGRIPAGRDRGDLSAHIDVLPTLADFCGAPRPRGVPLDGVSLSGLLSGRAGPGDRTLFVHSQRVEHPVPWRVTSVMTPRWRLIDGKELYDIRLDPAQETDVAARHPSVMADLRKAYDAWWASISSRFAEYVPIVIGAEQENPAVITCHDWHGENVPWNQPQVRQAPYANGWWAIEVSRAGRYEFELRQQPRIADHPLDAVRARLAVGSVTASVPVEAGARAVTLTVDLPAGPARLETELTGADGKSRGAFFVYTRRL